MVKGDIKEMKLFSLYNIISAALFTGITMLTVWGLWNMYKLNSIAYVMAIAGGLGAVGMCYLIPCNLIIQISYIFNVKSLLL